MKKIFILAAAAAVLFCSCETLDHKGSFNVGETKLSDSELAFTNASTRGYVETALFLDSPYDDLRKAVVAETPESDGKTFRAMQLSAYMTPQSGVPANYFVGQTFARNANGETDGLWHHAPKVYWPMGGTLSFLAYSTKIPFSGSHIAWDEFNAANRVVLEVDEDHLQDDILFSSVAARGSAIGDPTATQAPVDMTFKHAQAWIEFQLKVDEDFPENVVYLKDITIEKLYTRGELILTNNNGDAQCEWNYNKYTASDKLMDDSYDVTKIDPTSGKNFITETVQYMDMLIPAQPQTAFVMHYTLEGQDTVLEYRFPLVTAQWQAGYKYIYQITFKPYEITVNPTVTTFTNADVSGDGFPSTLE